MARDKPGPRKGEAYGVAAITQALGDVDFPVTKEELKNRKGNTEVTIRENKTVRLNQVLDQVQGDRFNSPVDITQQFEGKDLGNMF